MLDIKSLERRWLKYKIKSFLPYIFMLILSLVLLVGLSLWTNSKKPEQKPILQIEKVLPSTNTTNPSIPILEENTTFIEPSMEFIQSFQNTQAIPETSTPAVEIKKPIQQKINPTLATPKVVTMPEYYPPSAPISTNPKTSNNAALTINVDDSKLDIDSLERRFKETSNANLGLFIARYYYDHGNYNESYNYALKTNNINSRIDESWIVFAKTLVKLGKTEQAKKTLQLYISQSGSENAKGLLNSIENGSFK